MKYKIDLHTHSKASYDGGISKDGYERVLREKILDAAAITDHNDIGFAREMRQELGARIIVGEEITTEEGEIVGLYLEKIVPKNLSALETVRLIKKQGGIVYVPHPFETLRKGIDEKSLAEIVEFVDIIEVFNARARFRGQAKRARAFSKAFNKVSAASSDAHCMMGLGSSYSIINGNFDVYHLAEGLKNGELVIKYAPLVSYLCPFVNKMKKGINRYVK